MKILTALLLSLLVAANASAQDNTQPAATQSAQADNAPATPVAPIAAAPSAGGPRTCHARGWNCRLADQSQEVGAHCMCGSHPGNVSPD